MIVVPTEVRSVWSPGVGVTTVESHLKWVLGIELASPEKTVMCSPL